MGGSLSGEKRIQPPQFVEDAQRDAIMRAMEAADLGYVPYQGPAVAALSPLQEAVMQGVANDALAFGIVDEPIDVMSGMPEKTTMGGVTGYSPYPMYIEALERLKQTAPAQYDYIMGRKMNPQTGKLPVSYAPQPTQPVATGGGGGGVDIVLPQGKPPDVLEWLKGKGFNLGFGNTNSKVNDLIKAGLVGNNTPDPEFDAKKGSWKGGPF